MNFVQTLILDLTAADAIATVLSSAALLVSLLAFWVSRSDARRNLKLAAITSASEALGAARETIEMCGTTRPLIDSVFALDGQLGNSRRDAYQNDVAKYKKYAEQVDAHANSEITRIVRWWFPQFNLAGRMATLVKMKHEVISAQNAMTRMRQEFSGHFERALAAKKRQTEHE